MQLHLMTWQEVEAQVKKSTGIIIPIGSTEQHGPTGLIGTDAICPEVIARQAGDEYDFLIGPTFSVGIAQHHLAFPGSMSLRPTTMIATLVDWINSLSLHGINKFYFLNGHGGNVATVNAAFSEVYGQRSLEGQSDRPPVQCALQNWWELPGIFRLCKDLFPEGHGAHATPSEVAVTQYAYPEDIKQAKLDPKIAPTGPIRDAEDYRKRFPDGRIGSDPSLATPELGQQLVEASVKALSESYGKFMKS